MCKLMGIMCIGRKRNSLGQTCLQRGLRSLWAKILVMFAMADFIKTTKPSAKTFTTVLTVTMTLIQSKSFSFPVTGTMDKGLADYLGAVFLLDRYH